MQNAPPNLEILHILDGLSYLLVWHILTTNVTEEERKFSEVNTFKWNELDQQEVLIEGLVTPGSPGSSLLHFLIVTCHKKLFACSMGMLE